MAKIKLLVDTDIFIDYFNHGLFRDLLEGKDIQVYYSVVTRKELLSKKNLSDNERKAILKALRRWRLISLSPKILETYSALRKEHPGAEKEDSLIAATAITKKMPLATRNVRHYKIFSELKLYFR